MTNTPHKCPVCEGRGIVPCDFYTGPTYGASMDPVECRSCTGKGYVVLSDEGETVRVVERETVKIVPPQFPDLGQWRSPFWYRGSPYGGPQVTGGVIFGGISKAEYDVIAYNADNPS